MGIAGDMVEPGAQQDTEAQRAALMRLVLSWEQSARSQFACENRTADQMGARLVRHGGFCYYNCAAELRRVLGVETPQPLPTQVAR